MTVDDPSWSIMVILINSVPSSLVITSFVLEGSTVTYEVITNEDGTEFIRMTIIDQEGSSTVIEIPIGTGYFGDDGSGSSDGDGGG
jgi:hypothetical protein